MSYIFETIRRRKLASVGGITRWKRIGTRPDPRRSMRMRMAARKGSTRLKRKLAMRKLMHSAKGQKLRMFHRQMAKQRAMRHGGGARKVRRVSRPRRRRR